MADVLTRVHSRSTRGNTGAMCHLSAGDFYGKAHGCNGLSLKRPPRFFPQATPKIDSRDELFAMRVNPTKGITLAQLGRCDQFVEALVLISAVHARHPQPMPALDR